MSWVISYCLSGMVKSSGILLRSVTLRILRSLTASACSKASSRSSTVTFFFRAWGVLMVNFGCSKRRLCLP